MASRGNSNQTPWESDREGIETSSWKSCSLHDDSDLRCDDILREHSPCSRSFNSDIDERENIGLGNSRLIVIHESIGTPGRGTLLPSMEAVSPQQRCIISRVAAWNVHTNILSSRMYP